MNRRTISLLGLSALFFVIVVAPRAIAAVEVSKAAIPVAEGSISLTTDVIVVGAGLAGLSAALEAARAGGKVIVLDQASVFGGHAVMSEGDVTIVDTPMQRQRGIHDSANLAVEDFIRWGGDANPEWVRYYAENSKTQIYDWLVSLGVRFSGVSYYYGNSVSRAHNTIGRGLGLVRPVYIACLKNPDITFLWNSEAMQLILDSGRVIGLRGKNLRTRQNLEVRGKAVLLATGGFESNIDLALANWPGDLPKPNTLLAGSGINSMGSGLKLATDAGAALSNLDHQWNYERGLPDPRYPGTGRGLNAAVEGMRVNLLGEELSSLDRPSDEKLRQLLEQPNATYWSIFDEKLKHTFFVSGSDWAEFATIQRLILDNRAIVKKADSLDELALQTHIPADALKRAVSDHNKRGPKIQTAPFYAAQFYPMTRKSMGGISVDIGARVIDRQSHPIRGLYAAGEATGEAGINGKRALEGTFLGPAVITGRVAARSAIADNLSVRSVSQNRSDQFRSTNMRAIRRPAKVAIP